MATNQIPPNDNPVVTGSGATGDVVGFARGLMLNGYPNQAIRVTEALAQKYGRNSRLEAALNNAQEEQQRRIVAGLSSITDDSFEWSAVELELRKAVEDAKRLADANAEAVRYAAAVDTGNHSLAIAQFGADGRQQTIIANAWNQPDPEAVLRSIEFIDSDAWREDLQLIVKSVDVFNRDALAGIVSGRNARQLAQELGVRNAAKTEQVLRSLYLTSYREAQAQHQAANSDIIRRVIRIAALDGNTCFACVALHGTELEPGERVDDHRNGRCTSITETLYTPRKVLTGEQWINGLFYREETGTLRRGEADLIADMERQHRGAVDAVRGGVPISDFVQTGTDKVFGPVVTERSLKNLP